MNHNTLRIYSLNNPMKIKYIYMHIYKFLAWKYILRAFEYIPGKNIFQIFLEIFSEFLETFSQIFCRFWDIDEKVGDFSEALIFYSFSELLPNFFFNSQRFPHHFSDFLWFLNKTLTYRKAKNKDIWDFSKALIFQIFSGYLEGFFEFYSIFSKLSCPQFSWIRKK